MRKSLEVMNMFLILTVAMVLWVYIHVKSHHIVYVKYIQFNVY